MPSSDTGVGNREPSREIVTAIQHKVGALEDLGGVAFPHPFSDRPNLEGTVEPPHPVGRNFGLGLADIGLGKNRLALQV